MRPPEIFRNVAREAREPLPVGTVKARGDLLLLPLAQFSEGAVARAAYRLPGYVEIAESAQPVTELAQASSQLIAISCAFIFFLREEPEHGSQPAHADPQVVHVFRRGIRLRDRQKLRELSCLQSEMGSEGRRLVFFAE